MDRKTPVRKPKTPEKAKPDLESFAKDVFDILHLESGRYGESYAKDKEHGSGTLFQIADAALRHLGGHIIDNPADEEESFKRALAWRLRA